MNGNRPAAPAIPRTTAAVLMRAAGVIEANGWNQGGFIDLGAACQIPDPRQVPVCAAGAIRIAAGHDPDDCGTPVAALRVFAYWLSSTGQAPADADPVDRIGSWNDAKERTATEVAAELRHAAAAEAA